MLKNNLKIFLRYLKRHKGYTFINISGLAIGIACCIFIMLWVQNELSFDRFNTNVENLYRVVEEQHSSDGTIRPVASTPFPLGRALVRDYPEIIKFSRFQIVPRILIRAEDKAFYENGFAMADPSLLDMFTFPLAKGDVKNALKDPQSVLISEEMAKKYFGENDPIGERLTVFNSFDYTVTGILKNIPHNSHIEFDFLFQIEAIVKKIGLDQGWGSNDYYTYIQMQGEIPYEKTSAKIHEYLTKISPNATSIKFNLQPVKDIHLRSSFSIDLGGKSENKAKYVYSFTIITSFVLLIAWPAAWFVMNNWLQGFSYRTNIAWTSFLLAALLSIFIALLTVGYQSIKAAITDPVKALKYE